MTRKGQKQVRQMRLPQFRQTDLGARRTALVSFERTLAYQRFCRFLRDEMWLDCCIYAGHYRLDYVQLEFGQPQYRFSRGKLLLGKVYLKPGQLTRTQRELAAYLMAVYGFIIGPVKPTRIAWTDYKQKAELLLAKKAG
jgi:hypothetical protein